MSKNWKIIRSFVTITYSLLITFFSGKWAIYTAYMERGYKAVGSEYAFILVAYVVAYKCISWMFKNLEEQIYGRKKRSRGTTEI